MYGCPCTAGVTEIALGLNESQCRNQPRGSYWYTCVANSAVLSMWQEWQMPRASGVVSDLGGLGPEKSEYI